ncbi:DUF397 domain-containing protein [Streptomyces sp. NPDC087440]|uniref:DUF397 domain-containing protein n=1 Tax=Streptomyces sp. NPDC087440 TaxID=3365790 RepID=UPI00382007BE
MPELKWLKSSFSEASGNACVEVAATGTSGMALRESEDPDRVLPLSRSALGALVRGVKAGEFEGPRSS